MPNKVLITLIGILPSLVPYANQVSDLTVKDISKNENIVLTEDSNIDNWNEPIIVIDFSTIATISSENFETFDLEIEKRIINNRTKIRWRITKNGKWQRYFNEPKSWHHKGFHIGEMIDDFFKDNQKIIFKNLVIGSNYGYDLSQPDAMIAQLFMFCFKIPFSTLLMNYTEPDWYIAITGIGGYYGSNSYQPSIEEMKKWTKMEKTRKGRHQLNINYFNRNKMDEEYILQRCFKFVLSSTIFRKYNPDQLWEKQWI